MDEKLPTFLYGFLLFAVFVLYPVYEALMCRMHLKKVGHAFCNQHGYFFVGIGHAKAHYSVRYSETENSKIKSAKFRMLTSFGRFRKVEWLK